MTEQRQNDVTLSSPSSSPLHRWPCSAPPRIFWVGMDDGHMERKLKTRRHLKLPQSLPFKNEKTNGPKEISAIERENKRLRQPRFVTPTFYFLKGCWNLLLLILKRHIHTETYWDLEIKVLGRGICFNIFCMFVCSDNTKPHFVWSNLLCRSISLLLSIWYFSICGRYL